MEKLKLHQAVEELKKQYQNLQNQIEFQVLDNCNFIVEIGALTISTDETGKVITQNSDHPTQFTQKVVDEILSITFRNGNNEIAEPIVYGRNEWYNTRAKMIAESLELFENEFANLLK